MAPEVIRQDAYGTEADVWSLGICALELCNGQPPLADTSPMSTLRHIAREEPPHLEGGSWSDGLRDFVQRCLQKRPEDRWTAHALLEHEWIRGAPSSRAIVELVSPRPAPSALPIYTMDGAQPRPSLAESSGWDFTVDFVRTTLEHELGPLGQCAQEVLWPHTEPLQGRISESGAAVAEAATMRVISSAEASPRKEARDYRGCIIL